MTVSSFAAGMAISKLSEMLAKLGLLTTTFRRICDSRKFIYANGFDLSKDELKKNSVEHCDAVRSNKLHSGDI